jgi:hypothetical protein
MLAAVLDAHCAKHGIRSKEAREHVGCSLLALYQAGVLEDRELAARLNAEDDPESRSVGH